MMLGDGFDHHRHAPLFHAPRHLPGTRVERPRVVGDLAIDRDVQATAWEREAAAVPMISREIARGFQRAGGHP